MKQFIDKKPILLITFILSLVLVLIAYRVFYKDYHGVVGIKQTNDNSEATIHKNITYMDVHSLQFLENSQPQELPLGLIEIQEDVLIGDMEKVWKYSLTYRNILFNASIVLNEHDIFLRYEYSDNDCVQPNKYSQKINLSEIFALFPINHSDFNIKKVDFWNYENHILAIFTFNVNGENKFIKLECIEDKYVKTIYTDSNIMDVTLSCKPSGIFSNGKDNPIIDVLLLCSDNQYFLDIKSENDESRFLLPENIIDPFSFYPVSLGEEIYLATKSKDNSAVYAINLSDATIQKVTDTARISELLDINQVYHGGNEDNFVVDEYKNVLFIWSDDAQLSGFHMKESLLLVDKISGNLIWSDTSSGSHPYITYCIDNDREYCYVNCSKYIKCIEILTGKEIWTYRTNSPNGGFACVGNNIFLLYEKNLIMLDSETGAENKRININSNHIYQNKKKQNFCILEGHDHLKVLDTWGKIIKEIKGIYYYYYDNNIITVEYLNDKNVFRYINMDYPYKEITIDSDTNGNLHYINNEYLLLYEMDTVKLFSIFSNHFIWEKKMNEFHSALIQKDHIFLFGDEIVCAQVSNGSELWSTAFPYQNFVKSGFIIKGKLFVFGRVFCGTSRSRYWVYDIYNGKYLYQISDFLAALPVNMVNYMPIYTTDKEIFISNGIGVYSVE